MGHFGPKNKIHIYILIQQTRNTAYSAEDLKCPVTKYKSSQKSLKCTPSPPPRTLHLSSNNEQKYNVFMYFWFVKPLPLFHVTPARIENLVHDGRHSTRYPRHPSNPNKFRQDPANRSTFPFNSTNPATFPYHPTNPTTTAHHPARPTTDPFDATNPTNFTQSFSMVRTIQPIFSGVSTDFRSRPTSKTFGDFRRLPQTFGDFRRLSDTFLDFRRLSETFGHLQAVWPTLAHFGPL